MDHKWTNFGPTPYSEEWWLRLDVRNALRKAIESVRTLEPKVKNDG